VKPSELSSAWYFFALCAKKLKQGLFRFSSGLTDSGVKQMIEDKAYGAIPFKRSALMAL
jgi:hypothetical protein